MGLVFRLAVGMTFFCIVWFLVQAVFPQFSPMYLWRSLIGTQATTTPSIWTMDWFPTPRLVAPPRVPSITTNLYVPGPAYQPPAPYVPKDSLYYNNNLGGAAVDYVMYTASGTPYIVKGKSTKGVQPQKTQATYISNPQPVTPGSPATRVLSGDRSIYVRNLSIVEYGPLRKNATFIGEAKNTFFKDGKFPLSLMDAQGHTGIVGYAEARSDWTVAGWTRFQAYITATLPDNTACNLFFQSANVDATGNPRTVPFGILCMK